MAWQSKVASWVIPLVQAYLVPDDASVSSGVGFGSIGDAEGDVSSSEATFTAEYPGLVPNFSIVPTLTPTNGGFIYDLRARKGVGFHGVVTSIEQFDPKKFNRWEFPLIRRNFGYIALSRDNVVSLHQSILYEQQVHLDQGIFGLAANYDEQLKVNSLLNAVDRAVLNRASVFQYPSARTRVGFLPVWEEWVLSFFQAAINLCDTPTNLAPPGVPLESDNPSPPYPAGANVCTQTGECYMLICDPTRGYFWQPNGFITG